MPYLEYGNLAEGPHNQYRHWSDARKDEVQRNLQPESGETVTSFEIILPQFLREEILVDCFANMVSRVLQPIVCLYWLQ